MGYYLVNIEIVCILFKKVSIFFSILVTATPEPSPFNFPCHYTFLYDFFLSLEMR